jgi:hypothetical protein
MQLTGLIALAGAVVVEGANGKSEDVCAREVVAMVDYLLSDTTGSPEAKITSIKEAQVTDEGTISAIWSFADVDCSDFMKAQIVSFFEEALNLDVVFDNFQCTADKNLRVSFSVIPECETESHDRRVLSVCDLADLSSLGLISNSYTYTRVDGDTITVQCDTENGFTCDTQYCEQNFYCSADGWIPVDVGMVRLDAEGNYVGGCVPLECDVDDLDLTGNNYVVKTGTPEVVHFGESVLVNCAQGYSDIFWPSYQFQTVYCTDRDSFKNSVRAYCQASSTPVSSNCPPGSGTTLFGQTIEHENEVIADGDVVQLTCAEGFEATNTENDPVNITCGGENNLFPFTSHASLQLSSQYSELSCEPIYCESDDLDLGDAYTKTLPEQCSDECYTLSCQQGGGINCQLPYGSQIEISCASGYKSSDVNVETVLLDCMDSSSFFSLTGEDLGLICESHTTTTASSNATTIGLSKTTSESSDTTNASTVSTGTKASSVAPQEDPDTTPADPNTTPADPNTTTEGPDTTAVDPNTTIEDTDTTITDPPPTTEDTDTTITDPPPTTEDTDTTITDPPLPQITTEDPTKGIIEPEFGGLGVGGLAGLIVAIVVVIVIIIIVVVVVTNNKNQNDKKNPKDVPYNDEEDEKYTYSEDGDEDLQMHTAASKNLVDGIISAQMSGHSVEEGVSGDSGDATSTEDTGIEDFNNDSSTGAAQLIATIITAIDDVDVPAEETTTQEDPVPVTDATQALIGEVLANSEQDSAASEHTGDQSTMDSVDPSTESSSIAGRDDAYE